MFPPVDWNSVSGSFSAMYNVMLYNCYLTVCLMVCFADLFIFISSLPCPLQRASSVLLRHLRTV